jgi:hypothetical protein
LVFATNRRWRVNASLGAAFAAFTLALIGLTIRRAFGWEGVHDFAASAVGRAAAWLTLALVLAGTVDAIQGTRGVRGLSVFAMRVAHGALIVAAAVLVVVGFTRTQTMDLREGERSRVSDRFGTAWTLSLEGVSTVGRENVIANVIAVRAAAKGRGSAFMTAEVRSLYSGAASEPADQLIVSGVSAGLLQDMRLDVREATNTDAVVDVRFVPVATWLWIAGVVVVLAALLAALSPMLTEVASTGAPTPAEPNAAPSEVA